MKEIIKSYIFSGYLGFSPKLIKGLYNNEPKFKNIPYERFKDFFQKNKHVYILVVDPESKKEVIFVGTLTTAPTTFGRPNIKLDDSTYLALEKNHNIYMKGPGT